MPLEALQAAPVAALISLDRVKARLNVTGSALDETLGELIDEASGAIAALFDDPLVRQSYRQALGSHCRTRIQISRLPVDPDSVAVTFDGVSVTDYSIEDAAHGWLYRAGGWGRWYGVAPGEDPERRILVTYKAGYIPQASVPTAGAVTTWTASVAFPRGAWVRPSSADLTPLLMECTAAGTSGATEPEWPAAGVAVVDGGATWIARQAQELPKVIRQAAFSTTRSLYLGETQRSPGLSGWTAAGGVSESYFATHTAEFFPPSTKLALLQWRANR